MEAPQIESYITRARFIQEFILEICINILTVISIVSSISIQALQSTELHQTETSSKAGSIQNEIPTHASSCDHRLGVVIREEINIQRCRYFQQLRLSEQVRSPKLT